MEKDSDGCAERGLVPSGKPPLSRNIVRTKREAPMSKGQPSVKYP